MADNTNLNNAKKAKNDEFYTQLADIEKELMHYKLHFNNKVVYCNCDDPRKSKFWEYFHLNFAELGLKRLVATLYEVKNPVFKMEYEGGNDNDITKGTVTPLEGNGDFRNKECLDILDESDIVVTNPPFSLFRDFVATLISHDKKFLIVGSKSNIVYKEFFPLIKNNVVKLGYNDIKSFLTDTGTVKKFGNIGWFTNLDIQRNVKTLNLCKTFNREEYPLYDNYDAFNVNKVADIPIDTSFELIVTDGQYRRLCNTYGNDCKLLEIMEHIKKDKQLCTLYRVKIENPILGVPVTFLDKHNPEQFEIIGLSCIDANAIEIDGCKKAGAVYIDGKRLYARILIRHK